MKNTKKSNATEALYATTFFISVQAHDAPRIMQRVAAGAPAHSAAHSAAISLVLKVGGCCFVFFAAAVCVMKWGQRYPLRGIRNTGIRKYLMLKTTCLLCFQNLWLVTRALCCCVVLTPSVCFPVL